ncbi:hypothetical protein Ahy_B03g063367 [Arachis hypogaea]|uniref:F-box domain-containing protein n=1 Tax=Arachis hypogaea TaxID=3818 RepID=A0A444ZXK7_ARAHY|nr:hypothetical protein Ahy_B03g063367 [Arachis hypogaea]
MSDIFPASIPLLKLPNNILLDIFHPIDASTILKAHSTCSYWRAKLSSYDFMSRIHIIGIENGILGIRYSSMGKKSYLLYWNPVSQKSKILQDPVYIFQPDLVYLYAFVYFPYTMDYAILYIFKQISESPSCTLLIYTSFRRNWNVITTCPPYVVILDVVYVTLDGSIYWLTCSVEDVERRSLYIMYFSLLSNTFQQIFVPQQALA